MVQRKHDRRVTEKKRFSKPLWNGSELRFSPKTENQMKAVDAYDAGKNLVMSGMPGTGKTYVAMALGMTDVLRGSAERVVVFRSAVATRPLGFLPGALGEKQSVYEAPYRSVLGELFSRGDAYDMLTKSGMVEFSTTSYVRGLTLRDSVVIVDEMQNLNFHELDSVMTRLGEGSRIVFCGDYAQTDFVSDREKSGLGEFTSILSKMDEFYSIEMGIDDVVRSQLVKSYLLARGAGVRRSDSSDHD